MKSEFTVIVVLVVLICSSYANAGDEQFEPKSPGKATSLSLLGTVFPVVFGIAAVSSTNEYGEPTVLSHVGSLTFLVGSLIGPGLGHSYAGNGRRAATGMMIRMSCWFGAMAVAGAASGDGWDGMGVGVGAFLAATGLVTISSIWDIATAARSAREYNHKHGFGGLSVAPTFDLSKKQAGVRLSMQF